LARIKELNYFKAEEYEGLMKITQLLLVSVFGLWCGVATADFEASVAAFQKKDFHQVFTACYDDALKGEPRCQSQIAFLYENGQGLQQDYAAALKWHRLAAEQGNVFSQNALGNIYFYGLGSNKNAAEALKWFKLSAEQGNADGQNSAGWIYARGIGVDQDYAQSLKWFRLAANQGNQFAQGNLADLYLNGFGVEKNFVEALKWYRLAADQGNAPAQNMVGNFYASGGNGIEKDYDEAFKWYQLAAKQGNTFAESNLGFAYTYGYGVLKDYVEAAKWHGLAAEKDYGPSANAMAVFYRNGWGVEKSREEEIKWRLRAANVGDLFSQTALGVLYQTGEGVAKDDIEALKWLILAQRSAQESTKDQRESADKALKDLEAKLTKDDVLRATQLADSWNIKPSNQGEQLASDSPRKANTTESSQGALTRAESVAISSPGTSTKTQTQIPEVKAFALVIGNSAYRGAALTNPRNDAQAIAKQLASFGIKVDLVLDATRRKFVDSLTKFADKSAGADVILLYYAGHGVQYNGINYLVPVDVDLMADAVASAFTLDAISLNQLLEQYLPAKTRIIFLDACRDNPLSRSLARTRGGGARGLAPVSVASGTLISFATKDGSVAMDGAGRNSPFAEALLAHLGDPADINIVLRRVRSQVLKVTGNKQEPWEYGSLVGDELVVSTMFKKITN
jgi:uncharacterized protein